MTVNLVATALALVVVAVAVVSFAAGYLFGVRDRLALVQKELADLRRDLGTQYPGVTAQERDEQ